MQMMVTATEKPLLAGRPTARLGTTCNQRVQRLSARCSMISRSIITVLLYRETWMPR
jgi:hypothetical protein